MLTLNNLLELTELRKVTISMLMAFILNCNQLHIKIGKELPRQRAKGLWAKDIFCFCQ